jgi:cytochrome P450
VIKESLRCFPPIPMSQPRYVPSGGRFVSGNFIPEHTIVSAQAWSVHRLNEEVWRDGDVFRPERWVDSEEKEKLEMNRLFFAFGMGGRGCTGRQLVLPF